MLRRWAGALLLFSLGLLAGRLGCDFTAVSKLVIAPAKPLAVMATTMVDTNGDRTKRLIQRNVRIHRHFFPLSHFPSLC